MTFISVLKALTITGRHYPDRSTQRLTTINMNKIARNYGTWAILPAHYNAIQFDLCSEYGKKQTFWHLIMSKLFNLRSFRISNLWRVFAKFSWWNNYNYHESFATLSWKIEDKVHPNRSSERKNTYRWWKGFRESLTFVFKWEDSLCVSFSLLKMAVYLLGHICSFFSTNLQACVIICW